MGISNEHNLFEIELFCKILCLHILNVNLHVFTFSFKNPFPPYHLLYTLWLNKIYGGRSDHELQNSHLMNVYPLMHYCTHYVHIVLVSMRTVYFQGVFKKPTCNVISAYSWNLHEWQHCSICRRKPSIQHSRRLRWRKLNAK